MPIQQTRLQSPQGTPVDLRSYSNLRFDGKVEEKNLAYPVLPNDPECDGPHREEMLYDRSEMCGLQIAGDSSPESKRSLTTVHQHLARTPRRAHWCIGYEQFRHFQLLVEAWFRNCSFELIHELACLIRCQTDKKRCLGHHSRTISIARSDDPLEEVIIL